MDKPPHRMPPPAAADDASGSPLPYSGGVAGPPWVLGHRGAPREAPENTLASLRRALELGLDGVEYDLQPLSTGEAVVLHDDTLERTTDHTGPVGELTLPELAGIDAGGWFHKRFRGEPLPLLQEALAISVSAGAAAPLHMIEVKDPVLVPEVARIVAEFRDASPPHGQSGLGVRLASFDRPACVEAREHGLEAMLLAVEASEDDRRFVRDAGLAAYSVGPGGWTAELWAREWSAERWAWALDDPDELVWAARAPLFGWNTNEPHRALAARALARLAPGPDPRLGRWPVRVPALEVTPDVRAAGRHGAWSGSWHVDARVENPFPYAVAVTADLLVRGGAFEIAGLPASLRLGPRELGAVAFRIAGGSWSPGEDPRLLVRLAWKRGPGRPTAGELVLDTTLERRRAIALGRDARRLAMLVEHPGDRGGTMVVRRRGKDLLAKVEDPGGLSDVRALVRLGSEVRRGAVGIRVRLPADFDDRADGVPFSAGFQGRDAAGRLATRRWSGGVPGGIEHGAPGRLLAE